MGFGHVPPHFVFYHYKPNNYQKPQVHYLKYKPMSCCISDYRSMTLIFLYSKIPIVGCFNELKIIFSNLLRAKFRGCGWFWTSNSVLLCYTSRKSGLPHSVTDLNLFKNCLRTRKVIRQINRAKR